MRLYSGKKHRTTSTKRPIEIKIALLGNIPRNSVLMRTFTHQDEVNLNYFEPNYIKLVDMPLKQIKLTITEPAGITDDRTLQALSKKANIVMLAYNDFDEKRIQRQFDAIRGSIDENATVLLVGLKQKDEYLKENETPIKGVTQAERFASDKSWQHKVIELNNTSQANGLFFDAFNDQLQQQGLDEDERDDANAYLKEAVISSYCDERVLSY